MGVRSSAFRAMLECAYCSYPGQYHLGAFFFTIGAMFTCPMCSAVFVATGQDLIDGAYVSE